MKGETSGTDDDAMVISGKEITLQRTQMLFDGVLEPDASMDDVASHCIAPIVDNVKRGVNACVLAYGQVNIEERGKGTECRRVLIFFLQSSWDDFF